MSETEKDRLEKIEALARNMCIYEWDELPDQCQDGGWLDNGWENKEAWRRKAAAALKGLEARDDE